MTRAEEQPNHKPPPFRVGLCLAGAATGGAYSAGVIDFLFEALRSWELEKSRPNTKVPPWHVHITDLIGSSAGAITASLAAATLNLPKAEQSALRRVWVSEMNADRLLDCSDLMQKSAVSSLLNADFMASTAAMVLSDEPIEDCLPSWARNVCLTLRTTNLRGVPYSLGDFNSGEQNEACAVKFHMRHHADYSQFVLSDRPQELSQRVRECMTVVDVNEARTSACWQQLITCARASSAFPLAFPTVRIEKPKAHYQHRLSRPPDWQDRSGDHVIVDMREGDTTATTRAPAQDKFVFAANDGGALDNEPFDVLQELMKSDITNARSSSSSGEEVQLQAPSMILIDPFPESHDDPNVVDDGLPLLTTAMAVAHAVRAQAMFKETEIKQAVDKDDMSRFIISPVRDVKSSQKHTLATGSLHAFGGILHEEIRLHDYELGRANCKRFLESVFRMSKEEAWRHPTFRHFRDYLDDIEEESIAIIPVVGSAAAGVEVPKWPTYDNHEREGIVEDLGKRVERRLGVVVEILSRQFGFVKRSRFWRNPVQWATNRVVWFIGGRVVKFVERRIRHMIEDAMQVYS